MKDPIYHGGRLDEAMQQFGGTRGEWIDLSTGISPISYPIGNIEDFHWKCLPDSGAGDRLIQAARTYYRVPDNSSVVCANGTQTIINQLPLLFDHSQVSIISPTYNEHAACWEYAGHEVKQVYSISDVGDPNVVVLVNPNNPDGRRWQATELVQLARKLAGEGGALVVDEAFGDCYPELSIIPKLPENCIVLRSFGKFFGLAGVRLGFAIGSKVLAGRLSQSFGPWNVSGPALYIGARALADETWITEARTKQGALRDQLVNVLRGRGFNIVGTTKLFVLAEHRYAKQVSLHLKKLKILVRDFPSEPTHLRLGLCADEIELSLLDQALSEFVR